MTQTIGQIMAALGALCRPRFRLQKCIMSVNETETAETTILDRRWWKVVYLAGLKASLDKQPCLPPDSLTEDQRGVWLAGYYR